MYAQATTYQPRTGLFFLSFIKFNFQFVFKLAVVLFLATQLPLFASAANIEKNTSENREQNTQRQQEQCLRQQLLTASANTTLAEIRKLCSDKVRTQVGQEDYSFELDQVEKPTEDIPSEKVFLSERAQAIRDAANNPFTLASHKVNYILPVVYNPDPGIQGLAEISDTITNLDKVEIQFQLSLQLPLWRGFLGPDSYMSVAYTNLSFWQAYNSADSSPFRETNHEPELIFTWLNDWKIFGWYNVINQIALNHQSNGLSGPFSRSWNRVYANFVFERNNFSIGFKPWYRFPESRDNDDNPDIERYLGYFELTGRYRHNNHALSVMLRNNLRSDNLGAVELSWSFALTPRLEAYIRYFNGYGNSLIDYNDSVQTLGFGFVLAQGF